MLAVRNTIGVATLFHLVALPILAGVGRAQAPDGEVRFARIFADHMVLQRDKPVRVWGFAAPGRKVSVTITDDAKVAGPFLTARADQRAAGYRVTTRYVEENAPAFAPQTREVTTGADGRWLVELSPMVAGFAPRYLVAKSGAQGVAIGDVLIGEVWLCAGQSNMGWNNYNRKDRETPSSDFPGLRYVAWHDSWYKPLPDVRSNLRWQPCTPQNAERFSAVPFLYGGFLHRYLKVPVGIINVARGGTLGQTWCMRDELDGLDSEIVKTVLRDYDAETAKWDDPEQVAGIMAQWQKDCDAKRADHERKLADYKVALAKFESGEVGGKKRRRKPREPRLRLPKKPGDPRRGWSPPAGLFNATVMPIRDLRIRGVLYYQGENQAFQRWTRYEHTFPKVPASFRKAFGDPELPFGCISQPGWGNYEVEPEVAVVSGGYHVVRDIQRRALANDPHAGMIATYPTGNSYIHPAEKFPVAEYASRWALAKIYGKKIIHRGPKFTGMQLRNGKAYLFFATDPVVYERWKHIEKNAYWQVLPVAREGNAAFRGFILAGKDRRFYPGKARHARLDGKPCIEVASDLVAEPVAVRYGWAQWPTGNMIGAGRLPLPTFRTDDWPLPVGVNYSKEADARSRAEQKAAKEVAQKQALDRKIRQMQIDTARYEKELHLSKGRGAQPLVGSKLDRMAGILDELQKDRWLERQVQRAPELAKKIEELRKAVAAAKAAAERLPKKAR